MKKIAILGATGSIGRQALDIIEKAPGCFKVTALTAHRSSSDLLNLAKKFGAGYIGLTGCGGDAGFEKELPKGVKVGFGIEGLLESCSAGDPDIVLIAVVGIAGSVRIGDNVTLAGQAGVADNVTIEDGCIVADRAGVIGDLSKGSMVSGFPARDHRLEKRAQAARLHLPEVLQRLKALEAEVERLRAISEGGR